MLTLCLTFQITAYLLPSPFSSLHKCQLSNEVFLDYSIQNSKTHPISLSHTDKPLFVFFIFKAFIFIFYDSWDHSLVTREGISMHIVLHSTLSTECLRRNKWMSEWMKDGFTIIFKLLAYTSGWMMMSRQRLIKELKNRILFFKIR